MITTTDDHGRRKEVWLGANADHTTWVAHYQVLLQQGQQGHPPRGLAGHRRRLQHRRSSTSRYCYKPLYSSTTELGVKAGDSCTKDDDLPQSGKLHWQKNNLTDATTRYTYKQQRPAQRGLRRHSGSDTELYNYTYDQNGNRKEADNRGTAVRDLTFNPENQITTTGYTYDGAGNLTARPASSGQDALTGITYTAAEQPKSVVTNGTTYTYKHAGADNNELLQQTTPDGHIQLRLRPPVADEGPHHRDRQPSRLTGDGTANVITDPATGQALMLRTSTGCSRCTSTTAPPAAPSPSSPPAPTRPSPTTYDPYGLPTLTDRLRRLRQSSQNPYTFAGGIQDRTTGWVHYGNRYYDPTTGTWTQTRHPRQHPSAPGNANRYAYAGGDPINNTDPTGKEATACIGSVLLLAAAIIAVATTPVDPAGPAIGYGLGSLGAGLILQSECKPYIDKIP